MRCLLKVESRLGELERDDGEVALGGRRCAGGGAWRERGEPAGVVKGANQGRARWFGRGRGA
jgi:hypothetical protein